MVLLKDVKTKKVFRVYNTHLDHIGSSARLLGAGQIIDRIPKEKLFAGAPLIVMGDFNATLRDKSLKPLRRIMSMKALTPDSKRPTSGTYRYKGNWGWIDHILVSESLYVGDDCKARLYVQPWMQRMMNDGTWYPRRTYLGNHYAGGVSDHLPIFCDFYW